MQKFLTATLSLGALFALTSAFFLFGCSNEPDECTRIVYENSPEVDQFDMAFAAETGDAPVLKLEIYPASGTANKVIAYSLPEGAEVSLSIYTASGKLLKALLHDETKKAGFHGVIWDGTNALGQRVNEPVYVELNTGFANLISTI